MKIAYTVRCRFQDPQVAERWLQWLRQGHLRDVCQAGAESAYAVRLDGDETVLEARYVFAGRKEFEDYEAGHAPRLRQEGLELFPLELGLSYERSVGQIEMTQDQSTDL